MKSRMSPKYVFFDLANTLLQKESLYKDISDALEKFGFKDINEEEVYQKHKLLSEVFLSPDETSKDFYDKFNSELLMSLGIIPNKEVVDEIHDKVSKLQWQAFSDVKELGKLNVKIGVITNWDKTARNKIEKLVQIDFAEIVVSSEVGVAKPDSKIFKYALDKVEVLPNEAIMVGDSIKMDIAPALEAGMDAILLDRRGFYPYYKSPSLSSLAGLKDKLGL